MTEAANLEDWELLSSHYADDPKAFEGVDGDGDSYGDAINLDYFALDSENHRIERASSEEEGEEGGADSDNPTWVEPDSNPRDMERSGEVEFRGSGFPVKNSGGFGSAGVSDYRSSPADSEREELGGRGDSVMEVGAEGIEIEYQDFNDDESGKSLDIRRCGRSEGIETGHEENRVEESGEIVTMGDGSGSLGSASTSECEKRGLIWWKMPLEFIKFYVFKMRPVWSISIAAAIMGFVMLGRKLHKLRHKSRTIQVKIAFDDKKVSQLKVRAAHLNEAFTVVRRVPVIRTFPAGGVTAWPIVHLR